MSNLFILIYFSINFRSQKFRRVYLFIMKFRQKLRRNTPPVAIKLEAPDSFDAVQFRLRYMSLMKAMKTYSRCVEICYKRAIRHWKRDIPSSYRSPSQDSMHMRLNSEDTYKTLDLSKVGYLNPDIFKTNLDDEKILYSTKNEQQQEDFYKCDQCGKIFGTHYRRSRHVYISHDINPQTCDICGNIYRNKMKLAGHIRTVHRVESKPMVCPHCSVPFYNRVKLNSHLTKVRKEIAGIDGINH